MKPHVDIIFISGGENHVSLRKYFFVCEAGVIKLEEKMLEKICRAIPELNSELQMLIEEHLEFGGAGFKSRGKRILKTIK